MSADEHEHAQRASIMDDEADEACEAAPTQTRISRPASAYPTKKRADDESTPAKAREAAELKVANGARARESGVSTAGR
jgi:hypothetical protein